MDRLKTLEAKVRAELENRPTTRDDDRELTVYVYRDFYGVNPWAPFAEVLGRDDLPSQETIGRARRKLQEHNENLRGSKRKEKIRIAQQERFIEYAKTDTAGGTI